MIDLSPVVSALEAQSAVLQALLSGLHRVSLQVEGLTMLAAVLVLWTVAGVVRGRQSGGSSHAEF